MNWYLLLTHRHTKCPLRSDPEPPSNLNVSQSDGLATVLLIAWRPPVRPNGLITKYQVRIEKIEAVYHIPPECASKHVPLKENIAVAEGSLVFEKAQPATRYHIQVCAVNGAGEGQISSEVYETRPSGKLIKLIENT